MPLRRTAAFALACLLAGALLAACDLGSSATPTPVGVSQSTEVVPIQQALWTDTPTAAIPTGTPQAGPPATGAAEATATATVVEGTPTPTRTPQVNVQDLPDRVITETLSASINAAQWLQDSFTLSPDRTHIGYISASGTRFVTYLDDERSQEYAGVLQGTLTFSPDSKRFAYAAIKAQSPFMVVDGKEGRRYELIETGIVFSPNSAHLAYGAMKAGAHFIVLDGIEGKDYDSIEKGSIVFSPDSGRIAYIAGPEGQQFVAVTTDFRGAVPPGGKEPRLASIEGKRYKSILPGSVQFSPDGQHLAYAANDGAQRLVVVDGAEGTPYRNVLSLAWSEDGKHVVYLAQDAGNKLLVVADGQEGKKYDGIGGVPLISPDGKHVAYGATAGGKWFVAVQDLAAKGPEGAPREGKPYDALGSTFQWSPDSERLAFVAGSGGKQAVVVAADLGNIAGAAEGKAYDGIGKGTIAFSADGSRVAYVAGAGGKQFVVADGIEGKPYTGIGKGTPVFSKDGAHVIYAAVDGDKQTIVVDGKEGKLYDVAGKGGIELNPDGTFHYLAVTNNLTIKLASVYVVTMRLK